MSRTEFCEYVEILMHVGVRWLRPEHCVTRIQRLYDLVSSTVPYIILMMQL